MGLLNGLFDKKTDAEKRRGVKVKEIKKESRQDRKEARQEAREDKQAAREEARDERKDARQERRSDMKEIRRSDLKGKEKREAKADVREDKRDAIREANDDKRDDIDQIQDAKKATIQEVRLQEIEDLAAVTGKKTPRLDIPLALELLTLTEIAHFPDGTSPQEILDQRAATLRGQAIQGARAITGKHWKSDTECFVARTDGNDVVVAFRGSESPKLFTETGGFRDWVLTDFRAERIAYPPAPKSWPDQRWVHRGFWQAYQIVRNILLTEVTRQATQPTPARRIFVTGFSLGGALALLAALDIAEGMAAIDKANGKGSVPVELFSFAAPRVGDANLNNLVTERVAKSTLVAFRSDPVVHLPPFGPNFPLTFEHPNSVDLAGIHIGLGTPVIPQIGQQYRTAETLFYIDNDGMVSNRYPAAQVALNYRDHTWDPYRAALEGLAKKQECSLNMTLRTATVEAD